MSIAGDPTDWDEDCLSLNVWTPELSGPARPVMVWVHGGGFTTGTGASLLFRGDALAARRNVVVVTLNYRLGVLGFLAHPVLALAEGGGCGNWGLLDVRAALEWVGDAIEAFGGDPGNVTVFGESAGAMAIGALLAGDAAGRLFHRAIVQSGPPATASVRWASARAQRLAELLAIGEPSRRALEAVQAGELVDAGAQLGAPSRSPGELPLPFLPVVDGVTLSSLPHDALAAGSARRVPLLIGTTRDECSFFTVAGPMMDNDEHVMEQTAALVGREAAAPIVETYRRRRVGRGEPVTPWHLWSAITTDIVFRLPSLSLAEAHRRWQGSTFVYLFERESPFLGGALGAVHGLDVPFVFGTHTHPSVSLFTGTDDAGGRLAQSMGAAWSAFARTGDPSCEEIGAWPPYDDTRPTMLLGDDSGPARDPYGDERAIWEEIGASAPRGHHHG
jgi:para-nitrobenzyl esterase